MRGALTEFLKNWGPLALYLLASAFLLAKSSQHAEFTILGFVALIPLFAVIGRYDPIRLLLLGGYWGINYYLLVLLCGKNAIAFSWYAPPLVFCFSGLFASLARIAVKKIGCAVILLPLCFLLFDLSLDLLIPGFCQWKSHIRPGSAAALVAGFGGYGFVAFLLAAVNVLLLSIICLVDFYLIPKRMWTKLSRIATLLPPSRDIGHFPSPIRVEQPRAPPPDLSPSY